MIMNSQITGSLFEKHQLHLNYTQKRSNYLCLQYKNNKAMNPFTYGKNATTIFWKFLKHLIFSLKFSNKDTNLSHVPRVDYRFI